MPLFRRSGRSTKDEGTTLFFASDLHGSEICFKKFVNAARFYQADVLVLGGDISGKIVLPLVEDAGGSFRVRMHGRNETVAADAIAEFEKRAWNSGLYTRRMSPEEYAYFADNPDAVEGLFAEVVVSTVTR